ncbi:hypothetical protein BX616_006004, partial [Lobosporangium transversale]
AKHAPTHRVPGTAGYMSVHTRRQAVVLVRPRRRLGIRAIVSKPNNVRGFASYSPSLITTTTTPTITRHPRMKVISSTKYSSPPPSSLSSKLLSTSASLKKKHHSKNNSNNNSISSGNNSSNKGNRHNNSIDPASTAIPPKIEGDVIYRKEGSKIVPVDPVDQVEAPISGLFSEYEGFTRSPSSPSAPAPAPETTTKAEATNANRVDLETLTLRDVLPPDAFLKQLITQRELGVTVDEIKESIQGILDVLPLPHDDTRRVQAEKHFLNFCKKKNVMPYELASWSIQYTRDGAPLGFALLKLSVDQGDVLSRYSYGIMLYRGAKGVPADPVKGRAILESIAKPSAQSILRPIPIAMSTLASIYARDDKNFEAARDLYLAAANAGVVEARVALGRMYLSGDLPRDPVKAKQCFELAIKADDNNAQAHFLLGALEMENENPNLKAAFQHYQKAASKGLAEAQYNVGQAYFRGIGVPKNDALAIEYWKMSGQQGFGLAQLSLGAYYFQDETPQSQSEPRMINEWDPSKRDLMQAQKWFTLASRRPGSLGLEGKRLKAQVDEAIKHGRDGSKNGRPCVIM